MRPTWVEISRGALRHNYRVLRQRAQASGAELLCVIKADAYGHGLVVCGQTLAAEGAGWLGVTSVEEGVRLREGLAEAEGGNPAGRPFSAEGAAEWPRLLPRILVMGGAWKGEAEAVLEHELTPVVWEPYQLDLLERGSRRAGIESAQVPLHVEVETGMARQGVSIAELPALLSRLKASTGTALKFEGLHTHYASAEDRAGKQNQRQTALFCRAGLAARKADMWPRFVHGGNSSTLAAEDGTLQRLHELARGLGAHLLVRPGLGLFGHLLPERLHSAAPEPAAAAIAAELRPVLAWKTRVIGLRDVAAGDTVGYGATWVAGSRRRIALLPVGYADGYSRRHSRGNVTANETNAESGDGASGEVLVRGCRAAVVGRVSMDLTTVDVTGVAGVEVGDEVVLLGPQEGECVSAEEMGRVRATIPYEVLCGVGARVRRVAVE